MSHDTRGLYPRVMTGPHVVPVRFLEALGHLAVWAGCYAVGCVLFVAAICGEPLPMRGMLVAFLATTGTYLLDRVGIGSGLPDRADVASQPRRVHFLRRTIPAVRPMALGLLVAALALIASAGLLAALVVPASLVGMLLYGHTPSQRRLKDVLLIKNLAVAVSLAAMALVLGTLDASTVSKSALGVAGGALLLHVMAAAMLCDIDDQHADARCGTKTIPNRFGPKATWFLADVFAIMAGGLIWFSGDLGWTQGRVWPLAVVPTAAVLLMHLAKPMRVRHLVDISFPVAVVIAVLLSGSPPVTSLT